jgi:hypothetical protein
VVHTYFFEVKNELFLGFYPISLRFHQSDRCFFDRCHLVVNLSSLAHLLLHLLCLMRLRLAQLVDLRKQKAETEQKALTETEQKALTETEQKALTESEEKAES